MEPAETGRPVNFTTNFKLSNFEAIYTQTNKKLFILLQIKETSDSVFIIEHLLFPIVNKVEKYPMLPQYVAVKHCHVKKIIEQCIWYHECQYRGFFWKLSETLTGNFSYLIYSALFVNCLSSIHSYYNEK